MPDGRLMPDSEALFLLDVAEENEALARELGFPREGLATDDVESIYQVAVRDLAPELTDSQLVEAFEYYLAYDAFLPAFGAPSPPSREELLRLMDREFYDSLGEERAGTSCRTPDCSRATVHMSVFCRRHHFEIIRNRPCLFD